MTSRDSIYVIDSSVFIQAKRNYYPFDIVPVFWETLVELAGENKILSIDWVKKELERSKDELTDWAKNEFDFAFKSTDESDSIREYRDIMNWADSHKQYSPSAIAELANQKIADAWVVAFAKAINGIVVTQEVLSLEAKARIPIPNICKDFDVPYINTYEMLRKLGVRWGR